MGRKPKPINIAADIATGVPNAAAPSMNAPNQKGDEQGLDAAILRQP
jgi:hypothetical protein